MTLYAPGAVTVPSPNHSPRRDGLPEALVLHIMAGTLAGCDAWFTDPGNTEASAHFGVGKNGDVHQYVSTADAAWANGIVDDIDHGHAQGFLASLPAGASPNRFTISIEHEGQSGDPLEGAQFDASVRIAVWLFGPEGPMSGIPCDRYHVIRHSEIGNHPLCPGFTEDTFTRYIAAVNAALRGETDYTYATSGTTEIHEIAPSLLTDAVNRALEATKEPDVEVEKIVNADAIAAVKEIVQAVGMQDGEYVSKVTAGFPVPTGYTAYVVVSKDG